MRHFTLSEGSSNKFWDIDLVGNTFTVRYGKVGTVGQTQTKSFDCEENARAAHDKLVIEKLKKGYQEASPSSEGSTPSPKVPENATIVALWNRAEAYLRRRHPMRYQALKEGASEATIARLEKKLGVSLPEDFKASLRIHDGQKFDAPGILWDVMDWEMLSTDRIAQQWECWKGLYDGGEFEDSTGEPDSPRVKSHWWHPLWIPITANGCGDHDCLDLDPGADGHRGQMLRLYHDEGFRLLKGESFQAWFHEVVRNLEAGEAYDDGDGNVRNTGTRVRGFRIVRG